MSRLRPDFSGIFGDGELPPTCLRDVVDDMEEAHADPDSGFYSDGLCEEGACAFCHWIEVLRRFANAEER